MIFNTYVFGIKKNMQIILRTIYQIELSRWEKIPKFYNQSLTKNAHYLLV